MVDRRGRQLRHLGDLACRRVVVAAVVEADVGGVEDLYLGVVVDGGWWVIELVGWRVWVVDRAHFVASLVNCSRSICLRILLFGLRGIFVTNSIVLISL